MTLSADDFPRNEKCIKIKNHVIIFFSLSNFWRLILDIKCHLVVERLFELMTITLMAKFFATNIDIYEK